ncbi:major facilitator superfamily domain-containing protein [Irpex rosettiformis]|uniref:Major facilitator superfamily domain-containing protein n=1 Tax=Irpex rosettiformis TaxID=378272 RepID=A0ACB8TPN3_9APHY|nr:major facilitator superfamily domain-containing protein [Irpex rosettiformis]
MTSIVLTAPQQEFDDKEAAIVIQELPIPTSEEVSRRTSLEDKLPQYDAEDVQPIVEEWDGGWDAWSNVAGGWLAMAASFGVQNAYGVFQDFYTEAHTASPSSISWIGSIQLFLFTSMGIVSGKFVDRGYCRHTILIGSLLFTFSFFMLSIADTHQYYQLVLSQGVGMGLGGGLIYIPSLAVQSHRWRKRRSMAMGIVFSGSAIGGIIFPIMLNKLLSSGLGFAWTVRVAAFVVLGCLAVASLLLRPRVKASDTAQSMVSQLKVLFTDVPYMLLVSGAFISLIGVFYPYFYIQIFARTHGIPGSVGFYTLAILNTSSMFGRIIPNMLAPKYGVFNLLIFSGVGAAVVIFALFGISTTAGIVIFAILSGFMSGAYLSLIGVAITLHALSPAEIGLRMGLGFFFGALGALIGAPINGILLGDHTMWSKTLIFSGVSPVFRISDLAVCTSIPTYVGSIITQVTILGGLIPIVISRRIVVQERHTWLV